MKRRTNWKHKVFAGAISAALIFSMTGVGTFAGTLPSGNDPVRAEADGEEGTVIDMTSVSVSGVSYFYADTTGAPEDAVYKATVRGRMGSTEYTYQKSKLTQVADTGYYYAVPTGTALSGTLYGFSGGTDTTYASVYEGLGVSTDDSYDVVSSATNYTGVHAKDIPSLVVFGTDASGNKAITGLKLNRSVAAVSDAESYVNAKILNAVGEPLTSEQEALLGVTLKANPTVAPPADTVHTALEKVEYTSTKYGVGDFAVYPDATVDGYVWSEYWSNVYAVTISDGTTTAGAVHWIDMYGESATAGPHYNKVELAINNGKVPDTCSNAATVNRYAAFFDENGNVKAGTYTIKIYAEGYDTLTAEVKIGIELADKTADYTGSAIEIDPAVVYGTSLEAEYTYYTDAACTDALAEAPVQAGTYYVKASIASVGLASNTAVLTIKDPQTPGDEDTPAEDENKPEVKPDQNMDIDQTETAPAAEPAKDTPKSKPAAVKKTAQKIKVTTKSKKLKWSKLNKQKLTFKIKAAASGKGKLTFKKVKGNKKITVSKAGKVTVKKGLKKGTYKVRVKVSAAAKGNYKKAAKTVTVKVVVK